MKQEKTGANKESSGQWDHERLRYIRDQVILNTNQYLKDNGYAPIEDSGDQNFSETDLDSLDLMMLAEKIAASLDIDMELTALIDYPSVQSLCEYIHNIMVSGDHNNLHIGTLSIFIHLFEDKMRCA